MNARIHLIECSAECMGWDLYALGLFAAACIFSASLYLSLTSTRK